MFSLSVWDESEHHIVTLLAAAVPRPHELVYLQGKPGFYEVVGQPRHEWREAGGDQVVHITAHYWKDVGQYNKRPSQPRNYYA